MIRAGVWDNPVVDARTNRLVQIGLGIALVVVVVGSWLLIDTGQPNDPPAAVERLSPVDGSQVPRQQPVVVDMAPGVEVELFVQDRATGDWVGVDPARAQWEPATGVLTWSPPEDSTPSGDFQLRIEYRAISGLPEQGAYQWTIRTY